METDVKLGCIRVEPFTCSVRATYSPRLVQPKRIWNPLTMLNLEPSKDHNFCRFSNCNKQKVKIVSKYPKLNT